MIFFGNGYSSASSCSTSSEVDGAPLGVFFMIGSDIFSNKICWSCLVEPRLKGSPASSWTSFSSSAIRVARSWLCWRSFWLSINTPSCSIRERTQARGISTSISKFLSSGISFNLVQIALCKRSVISASSAAYGPASSRLIWLNVSCLAPLPAISSKWIVLWPK